MQISGHARQARHKAKARMARHEATHDRRGGLSKKGVGTLQISKAKNESLYVILRWCVFLFIPKVHRHMHRKEIRELSASIIIATLSLFIVPILYLIVRPIPADIYTTFRLFSFYTPLSIGAFFWIHTSSLGLVFGVLNWGILKSSQTRPVVAGVLLSIPSLLFLSTLLLGSGELLSSYRWFFMGGLVVLAPLIGIGFLALHRRLPKKLHLIVGFLLITLIGLIYWGIATALGSVATLYPFLFVWLQSVWSFSLYLLWLVVREDLPRMITPTALVPLVLCGTAIDLSGQVEAHYIRAQTILMWRMPEVVLTYDLRGPLRLVKARSRVLFPPKHGQGVEMVDLGQLKGPTQKPHILIIVMDAFRYDRLSTTFTPHTFALAKKGTSFSHAYSPSPTTEYSLVSLMTGLRPSHLMALESIPLTFPQYLSYFGYQTGVSAPLDWNATLFPLAASGSGYQWDDLSRTRDDAKSLQMAVKRIVDAHEPRFEYVHLMGTHGPFRSADAYEIAVKVADAHIGRGIEALGARLENTIVVIAGDHGEALGEHGMWAHSQSLYEEQTRIPIVFNRVVSGPDFVSLREVPILISDLIGGDFPYFIDDPNTVVQEFHIVSTLMWRSIRRGKWAYHRRLAQGDELLFDLEKDPLEGNNLASTFPDVVMRFRATEKKVMETNTRSTFREP